MRRIFGKMEAIFDILYLAAAGTIGSLLLFSADLSFPRLLAGAAAIFLTAGDAFHLLPRIHGAFTGKEEELKRALGRGKKIASLTMTIFYLILWHIGLLLYEPRRLLLLTFGVWMLAGLRALLCLSSAMNGRSATLLQPGVSTEISPLRCRDSLWRASIFSIERRQQVWT
ncbi:MAG TPA: hypothetical protein PLY08_03760 [Bacillota bacterium]|nr:hypothetical protein [Bacillota bacterium]